ncbi:MAG: hypothetical protein LBC98_01675 [Prevotellaceae bacterium]|jgi:hypothetical protein|nr:hypothetical protein [Prevotellaceae bacterium]
MENKQLLYADKALIFGFASAGFFCAASVLAALILFTDGALVSLQSAAISLACFVAAIISGSVAISMGNKAIRIYNENPSSEIPQKISKLQLGRICANLAIAASTLVLVAATLIASIFGIEKLGI